MAKLLVSDDLWAVIAPLLPPMRPKPKDGRHRAVRAMHPGPGRTYGHPVRAQDWLAVGVSASRGGLRLRHVVLASLARLAGSRRVGGAAPDPAGAPGERRATQLVACLARQRIYPGQRGGEATGLRVPCAPRPTDRGKPGTKRHSIAAASAAPHRPARSGEQRVPRPTPVGR